MKCILLPKTTTAETNYKLRVVCQDPLNPFLFSLKTPPPPKKKQTKKQQNKQNKNHTQKPCLLVIKNKRWLNHLILLTGAVIQMQMRQKERMARRMLNPLIQKCWSAAASSLFCLQVNCFSAADVETYLQMHTMIPSGAKFLWLLSKWDLSAFALV